MWVVLAERDRVMAERRSACQDVANSALKAALKRAVSLLERLADAVDPWWADFVRSELALIPSEFHTVPETEVAEYLVQRALDDLKRAEAELTRLKGS